MRKSLSLCDRPFLNLRPQLIFTLYYQLYATNDTLESSNPIYANDTFISRISIKSITPPCNVISLKRHLWKIEAFDGIPMCSLYLSLSEKTPKGLNPSTGTSLGHIMPHNALFLKSHLSQIEGIPDHDLKLFKDIAERTL